MGAKVEPAKKVLLPYLQRADELQKHEPVIAYYCRLYAMEHGLKIPVKERTKTTNAILVSLMNRLEKDKKSVQVSPEDSLHVEGFALNVFAKADKQGRVGRADLNTAKTFYVVGIFMDILNQFGLLQPDIEQKQKYAIWKAADIRKALGEGRKPIHGPPGGDEALSGASNSEVDDLPKAQAPSKTSIPSHDEFPNLQRFPSTNSSNLMGVDEAQKVYNNHGASNDNDDHYSIDRQYGMSQSPYDPPNFANRQYGMPQLPHDPPNSANSGYPSTYPSSYYPSPAAPTVPSTQVIGQYGDTIQPDAYNGQSHTTHYNDYMQNPSTGFTYPSSNQTSYAPNNGTLDTSYYQAQGGHMPGAMMFSASTPPPTIDHYSTAPPSSVRTQPYQPPHEKIADAQKAGRFAVSSLAFDDVTTDVQYLEEALALLSRPS